MVIKYNIFNTKMIFDIHHHGGIESKYCGGDFILAGIRHLVELVDLNQDLS